MKKFLTIVALLGTFGIATAQTSTEPVAPVKEAAVDGVKATEAGTMDAKEAVGTTKEEAAKAGEAAKSEGAKDAKAAGCCAGKGKDAKCDHAKAGAGDGHGHADGHGHDHASAKAHVCTDACKGDAHALACGEEGHKCAADCHAKK
ncbi:MAG TPA: hypothetical protein PLE78_10915 [Flavobacteriales bacterium]|nr:hypothetical protein [Flavobacteriales bacterium]MBP6643175.1 hypothetical protein [Flavobacteriales bacterium]HQV75993.1 hypothetical protein [Flavobacteriales bacterium]HQW40652.1 hypothetical protein [Flavobacteriales bacterium]